MGRSEGLAVLLTVVLSLAVYVASALLWGIDLGVAAAGLFGVPEGPARAALLLYVVLSGAGTGLVAALFGLALAGSFRVGVPCALLLALLSGTAILGLVALGAGIFSWIVGHVAGRWAAGPAFAFAVGAMAAGDYWGLDRRLRAEA